MYKRVHKIFIVTAIFLSYIFLIYKIAPDKALAVSVFTDETATYNLADAAGLYGYSAAWGDFDGDGDLDLYTINRYNGNKLYRNNGAGAAFTDVTATYGVGDGTVDHFAANWVDFDNDGDLDLYSVNSGNVTNTLYRNNGVGVAFTDVTATYGVSGGTTNHYNASWFDFDDDGDQDVYLVNRSANNTLLLNNGTGLTFTDATATYGIGDGATNHFSCAWADFDNDGDLDLYSANVGAANVLLQNNGLGSLFTDVTATYGVADGTTLHRSSTWVDFDNDGDLDLYSVSQSSSNILFQNNGVGVAFTDVTATYGVGAGTDLHYSASWIDIDNDADLDLYCSDRSANNKLYINNGTGVAFTESAASYGIAGGVNDDFAASWVDVDGDNDLDLYLTLYSASNVLLTNPGQGNNYLKVVVNDASGHYQYNARVEIDVDGNGDFSTAGDYFMQYQSNSSYSGSNQSYVSQGPVGLYFGLGADATCKYDVRIFLPNVDPAGPPSSQLDDVCPNQLLTDPEVDAIVLSTPVDYQVIQRSVSDEADISITGTYTGSPTTIEASWDGASWGVIDAAPVGGTYSGSLSSQPVGQGTLSVRFSNDISVEDSADYVGIGDIFIIAGQSNASGRGTNNQSYSHAVLKATMFGNDDVWKDMTDPVDSSVGQVDAVSVDATAGGTVWPELAEQIMNSQDIPVAFVPCAKGSTSITQWQRNDADPDDTTTLYGSMYRRITAIGGEAKAVLFWQGESDAISATPRAVYLGLLNDYANDVESDFGIPTVVAQIGDFASQSGDSIDNVRLAQLDAWEQNDNVYFGPSLYDVDLSDGGGDGVHFKTDAELLTASNRWWVSISEQFYNINDGRGPSLLRAKHNQDKDIVYLKYTEDTLPMILGIPGVSFVVEDDGVPIAISMYELCASDIICLHLSSSATGVITVSFASGHTGTGVVVPTDSSAYFLPSEIFVDEVTSLNNPPTVDDIELPVNSYWTDDATVILSFDISDPDSSDTLVYQVQVATDSSFSNIIYDYTETGGTVTPRLGLEHGAPLASEGTYFWRVKAIDEYGSASAWSVADYGSGFALGVDRTPPERTSFSTSRCSTGEGGPFCATIEQSVTDNLSGTLEMMYSTSALFEGASWEGYSGNFTLSSGQPGTVVYYFKFRDRAGNESDTYVSDVEFLSLGPLSETGIPVLYSLITGTVLLCIFYLSNPSGKREGQKKSMLFSEEK